ncbi:MAG: sigma-70 family RNA polymerase sigma factor, partial [Solimonas sp.]
ATVARRLVANFYRDQAIEQAYLDLLAAQPEAATPSAEEQYLVREALLEIDRLLDGLGGKVKQAFLLAQFEELPYAEIAARLGISLRSVNNYVARAMAHCCQALP